MRSRTSKTIVALLAAIVVLLVRGTRQQRRIRRALFTFGLYDWITDGWNGIVSGAGAVTGFFSGVAQDVKDLVLAVVRIAVQDLLSVISTVNRFVGGALDAINSLFAYTVDQINRARQWASDVGTWVFNQLLSLLHDTQTFLTALVNNVHAFAQSVGDFVWGITQALVHDTATFLTALIDNARRFAQDAATFALDLAKGLIHDTAIFLSALVDNVHAFAQAVGDFVWGETQALVHTAVAALEATLRAAIATADDALHAIIDTAIAAVRAELKAAVKFVEDEVFGPVAAVIGVVTDVLDWLIGLAAFPFTTAREMWGSMRSTGGATVLTAMPDTVDRWADHVLSNVKANVAASSKAYTLPPLPDHPGGGGSVGGTGYPFATLVALANGAGVNGQAANIAAAVALAESGGDPNDHNTVPPDDSYGLWQINMYGTNGPARRAALGLTADAQLFDPATNARAMAWVSGGGVDFTPWTTFVDGAYRQFLPAA